MKGPGGKIYLIEAFTNNHLFFSKLTKNHA